MPAVSPIETRIRASLADYLKRSPDSIQRRQSLRDDLGLDSMATIELLFRIEEVFELQIPDQDLQKLTTVGDVIAYVEEKVSPLARAPSRQPPKSKARKRSTGKKAR